jgi:bacterioferritin (cytochrome b1)
MTATVFEDDLPLDCAICQMPLEESDEMFDEAPGWVCERCYEKILRDEEEAHADAINERLRSE